MSCRAAALAVLIAISWSPATAQVESFAEMAGRHCERQLQIQEDERRQLAEKAAEYRDCLLGAQGTLSCGEKFDDLKQARDHLASYVQEVEDTCADAGRTPSIPPP